MTAGDDDWKEVAGNLQKARKSWGRMLSILIQEEVDPKVSGKFFKALVQAVLLFRAEMWVLTPRMERALIIFQYRVARWLIRRHQGGRDMGFGNIIRW